MATQETLSPITERPEGPTRPPHQPHRRWVPWVLVAAFGVIAVMGWRAARERAREEQAVRAAAARRLALQGIPIAVSTVRQENLPVYLEGLGSVTAFNTDTIVPRVAGQIMKFYFHEGQHVAAGQLLAQIDPRPYQVQLEQAQGQLAHDQAQLHDALLDLGRDSSLYHEGIVTLQQLNSQQALVGQLRGSIESDQAQIASAKLNLTYCRLTAPISGKIGLEMVNVGNYVQPGTAIVVITQMEPIKVIFTLPEGDLSPILRGMRAGQTFPVEAYDRADVNRVATGVLAATDNQINQTTGTLRLEARFANRNEALFPNEFVNIHIQTEVLRHALVMPAAALQHGMKGDFVFVVLPDKTVQERLVKVEMTQGNQIVLKSGVQRGETVVTEGQDRLRAGSHVILEPSSGTPVNEEQTL